MSWKDNVPNGFGIADVIFAGHPSDEASAKTTIKAAKAAGASFDDFAKEVVWHCYKNVNAADFLKNHTDAQVAKAKTLWR